MSFPSKVKDEALVACGRHCCICHRFRGLKIELHHIVQQSEGGDDSFDNCMPLCFDCYGDMRSYDSAHPKGTKYTPSELRSHRDAWYAKVRTTGASASTAEHLEIDRRTMHRLLEILPYDGPIEFLRHHHFGGAFLMDELTPFTAFRNECRNPAFEFLDADIEGMRATLLETIGQFRDIVSTDVFLADTHARDVMEVPPEWKIKQPERYDRVIEQLHLAASRVCDAYDQLVRAGHRKLGVSSAG
jgi:hypothetical protein